MMYNVKNKLTNTVQQIETSNLSVLDRIALILQLSQGIIMTVDENGKENSILLASLKHDINF